MLPPAFAADFHDPRAAGRSRRAAGFSVLLHLALVAATLAFGRREAAYPLTAEPAGERVVSVSFVQKLPPAEVAAEKPAEEESNQSDQPADAQSGGERADAIETASGARREATAAARERAAESLPPDFAPPIDLAGALAELTADIAVPAGDVTTGGLGGVTGDGFAGEGGGRGRPGSRGPGDRGLGAVAEASRGTASLFGISAEGARIVYIIDRSDSMNSFGGRPWRAAKSELRRSLATLSDSQFFQIIFYNDAPRPYRDGSAGGIIRLIQAEPQAIRRADRYVDSARAFGGTNHLDALRTALRMGPDVVFFLTDGHIPSLNDGELAAVRRLADSTGAAIHAIEFGTSAAPDPNTFVRVLASQNRGEYRYFDVSRFSSTAGTFQQSGDRADDAGQEKDDPVGTMKP